MTTTTNGSVALDKAVLTKANWLQPRNGGFGVKLADNQASNLWTAIELGDIERANLLAARYAKQARVNLTWL